MCKLYHQAPQLLSEGTHVVSTDEMTGIPAWERAYPDHAMESGKVKLQEFEYIRHGACCLIANWSVATGQVIIPSLLPTRRECDFANHIALTIESDPEAGWVFIVDQLNTHQSASLVRLVAACCKLDIELGIKGKSGILKSMATRAAFLSDESHRIRFVYVPKHTFQETPRVSSIHNRRSPFRFSNRLLDLALAPWRSGAEHFFQKVVHLLTEASLLSSALSISTQVTKAKTAKL